MASASRGLELPATSLMAPFLPDISVSLKRDFRARESRGRGGDIKGPATLAIHATPLSLRFFARFLLRQRERTGRRGRGRGNANARCSHRQWSGHPVGRCHQEGCELFHAFVGDAAEQLIIGGGPAALTGLALLLAAQPRHALL